jgi:hypothetical protein
MPYKDAASKRAYQRRWVARRRAIFFGPRKCAWCSSRERLELHHLDTSKKENHAIWSWGEKRREAEIAKCIVLCRPCHQKAHAQARRVEAELRNPCGTWQAYKRGCKCLACRAANAEYLRELAARKRAA